MIKTPLEQFEINPLMKLGLGWLDLSLTNSSLTLLLIFLIITLILSLIIKNPKLIPTRWQAIIESLYQFNQDLIKEQIGEKGKTYFPMIFTLFTFILLSNLIGMIPYSFTITSHIVVTFAMSLTIFVGVTILGFLHHKVHFFKILLPSGASIFLAPLLIVIEFISYFARAVSLAVRLAANMMAGHTLLKIISTFAWKLLIAGTGTGLIIGIPSLGLLFLLTGLELAIAILQAYVFTILTCSYLNDSINLH